MTQILTSRTSKWLAHIHPTRANHYTLVRKIQVCGSWHVQAAFEAHCTPDAQQGVCMVCALRVAAMCFWFLECNKKAKHHEMIAFFALPNFAAYVHHALPQLCFN